MKNILLAFGTRPEAIKLMPIIKTLQKLNICNFKVCVSGQHREMLDQVLRQFNIEADYDLNIMTSNQTLSDITVKILNDFCPILKQEQPDLVLVHGDTTTAFSVALACFYNKIPVGHVEAGLRTYKMYPYPEEFNRIAIDHISSLCFAPTSTAQANLINEGIPQSSVFMTGNTIVDVFKYTLNSKFHHELLEWVEKDKIILLTLHRRENLETVIPKVLKVILDVVNASNNIKVIYPVHLNPKIKSLVQELFCDSPNFKCIAPLNVIEFHNILQTSDLVITDSGGVQEEAVSLKKNLFVVRDFTERTEISSLPNCKLVSCDELYSNIIDFFKKEHQSFDYINPYSDGNASERIIEILSNHI